MRRTLAVLTLPVVAAAAYAAQPGGEYVTAALDAELQPRAVTTHQLTQYMAGRISPLPAPKGDADWTRDAARLRRHVLDEVVFRGWPREWVTAPAAVEELGVVMTSSRYRIRKLRYEIVPGMRAPALVCEPVSRTKPAPGVLNLIGHEDGGKGVAHAQQRCIAFAKMGIVALTPEWPGFGELAHPHNAHDFAAHLEAAGANALGFFYLAMRHALDQLVHLPSVDRRRIGVTGLSGGGWQSVMLGALDERVAVVVEVAGVGSLDTTLTHPSETDEIEENATDLGRTLDYPALIAMRAPRPTLLIHNVNDGCCFRAGLVKPFIHDAVKPFFALYGKAEQLAWYENAEPGTHNYERDNRRTAYRFFAQHFGLRTPDDALAAGEPGPDAAALTVGVPRDNLTILGVAKVLAARARRAPSADRAIERARLIDVVRYHPSRVTRAWPLWSARAETADTLSYRLDLDSELGATAVWFRPHTPRTDVPVTIVLHDDGRAAASELVSEALGRGSQVLAVNLLFFGDMVPEQPASPGAELGVDPTARPRKTGANYQMLLSMLGERALGLQASQLLAVARWAQTMAGANTVRVDTRGLRSQMIALVAAALEPRALAAVTSRQTVASLRHLLDAPVPYRAAPELFCLDLYKDFDVDRLTALAEPTSIHREGG